MTAHVHRHAFAGLNPLEREGLVLHSRRNMLKAGLAGLAGLTVPGLLRARAETRSVPGRKSVILLWMAGGPSHIDTWDPKPDRPVENRGPFGTIATKLPGVRVCEHLPKMAAMLDKFTLIRSVDATTSNHEPNKVFQTGYLDVQPRTNRQAGMYPAIGSVVAKFRGANHPSMPAYAAFMKSRTHLAFAGALGKTYDPFIADQAARLPVYTNVGVDTGQTTEAAAFRLAEALTQERLDDR